MKIIDKSKIGIAIIIGAVIAVGLWLFRPVKIEFVKSFKNCSSTIDSSIQGDFIHGIWSLEGLDLNKCLSKDELNFSKGKYFWTYECQLKEMNVDRILPMVLSKWPYANAEYYKFRNNDSIYLYKIYDKEIDWPK